jgi:hypothetical protein
MKEKTMRTFKSVLAVVAMLVVGVGAMSAEEKLSTDDGRVNYWQTGATAAVYCDFSNLEAQDDEKGDFTGIEVLHIDPATGNGSLALDATLEEIDAAGYRADTFVLEENGYQLWRTADGGFRVNGGFFNFEWDRNDLNC